MSNSTVNKNRQHRGPKTRSRKPYNNGTEGLSEYQSMENKNQNEHKYEYSKTDIGTSTTGLIKWNRI